LSLLVLRSDLGFTVAIYRGLFLSSMFLNWSPLLSYSFSLTKTMRVELSTRLLNSLLLINLLACVIRIFTIKQESAAIYLRITFLALITSFFFTTESWIIFYVWFELSLVPIFLIILGWGYQRERISASIALIFYTISGSMPLFLVFATSLSSRFSHIFQIAQVNIRGRFFQAVIVRVTLGFLVKLPVCCLHIWLPKAHVEAPVVGSIFLAAILLKIGGLGLIKVSSHVSGLGVWLTLFRRVSLWRLVIINFICVQRSDLKVLIAFSSVAHIAVALLGLRLGTQIGLRSMLIIILGHGISSSIIFFYSYLFYLNSSTRSLLLNKALKIKAGLLIVLWGVSCVGIIGGPPTINLWFEISAFLSILGSLRSRIKAFFWGVFLTGVYTLICLRSSYSRNQLYRQISFLLVRPISLVNLLYHFTFLFTLLFLFF